MKAITNAVCWALYGLQWAYLWSLTITFVVLKAIGRDADDVLLGTYANGMLSLIGGPLAGLIFYAVTRRPFVKRQCLLAALVAALIVIAIVSSLDARAFMKIGIGIDPSIWPVIVSTAVWVLWSVCLPILQRRNGSSTMRQERELVPGGSP